MPSFVREIACVVLLFVLMAASEGPGHLPPAGEESQVQGSRDGEGQALALGSQLCSPPLTTTLQPQSPASSTASPILRKEKIKLKKATRGRRGSGAEQL